jgi:hypothetical protein
MTDEEHEEGPTLAEVIAENVRSWNSYWSWKDKLAGEYGAAHEILTAAGIAFEGLVSRTQGQDPPDCEAIVDGCPAGIEVTELVHQKTLERSIKAQRQQEEGREPEKAEAYFVWNRAELLRALQTRINAKDQTKPKGGPYTRYILVVHTDEAFLGAGEVEQWLTGATFLTNRISDVLLGLSYNPAQRGCPVFKLRVCRSDQGA